MPLKGGRPCVVATEITQSPDGMRFDVGHVERVIPFSVEETASRVVALVGRWSHAEIFPCVVVDTGSAQGLALYQQLRGLLPRTVHRPHSYPGTGTRDMLFGAFLQSYAQDRLSFRPDLEHRGDLDRALVFFGGRGVKSDGVDLSSEDEAMVMAVGLSMQYAKHGDAPRHVSSPKVPLD